MEGLDDHSRGPSGGESDFETTVELYALEGQFGRSEDGQLTFGQITNHLADGWWLAMCWVEGPMPLLPVRISRKVDSRLFEQPENLPNPSLGILVFVGASGCEKKEVWPRCVNSGVVPAQHPNLVHGFRVDRM